MYIYVYIQPGIKKFSTHANTSSFNGLILCIDWLTVKKACLWQMLMYTTWILQQVALNSYSAQFLDPLISQLMHRHAMGLSGSWSDQWPVLRCPGVPPVAKSQPFWSLQYLAQSHCRLAPKPSAWLVWLGVCLRSHLLTQVSRACAWAPASAFWCLGPCDLWWYNSSCWRLCFRTWSPNGDFPSPRKTITNVV